MTKHEDKEQGNTLKHEAPLRMASSINYRGVGGGVKIFLLSTNFTIGPDVILNTKIHIKFGSHNGSLPQSMHKSEDY